MAKLTEVVEFLDRELRTREIPDYPGAHNGLQLENSKGEVTKLAVSVDASLAVIEEAVARGADLLVVHHGMFWQGVRMITGAQFRKLKLALENQLAIYSSHLPLDVHPEWGNNAVLARELGLQVEGRFLSWKGVELGVWGRWEGSVENFAGAVEKVVGPTKLAPGCEGVAGKVGIITGGAGSEIEAVQAAGIETFLTGEGPHWSFPLAQELGLKVIQAGHYATETFGVKAVAEALVRKFCLKSDFLDFPSGL